MKPGPTVPDSLIYADWLEDQGDLEGAAHWRFIAAIQQAVLDLWVKWGAAWLPSQLRGLPMLHRTKSSTLTAPSGKEYTIKGWFARREIIFTLFEGHYPHLKWKAETCVRRSTISKHAVDVCLRNVVLRLLAPKPQKGANRHE
jgi:hypothetical protein